MYTRAVTVQYAPYVHNVRLYTCTTTWLTTTHVTQSTSVLIFLARASHHILVSGIAHILSRERQVSSIGIGFPIK